MFFSFGMQLNIAANERDNDFVHMREEDTIHIFKKYPKLIASRDH